MKRILFALLATTLLAAGGLTAAENADEAEKKEESPLAVALGGFALREIGPAFTSGRITELVVHPDHKATWYVTMDHRF